MIRWWPKPPLGSNRVKAEDQRIAAFGSSYRGTHSNVGAAEGCDLLIFNDSKRCNPHPPCAHTPPAPADTTPQSPRPIPPLTATTPPPADSVAVDRWPARSVSPAP